MSESLKELGRLLKESKQKITAMNKEVDAEKEVRDELEGRLIAAMKAAGTDVVKNEHGNFRLKTTMMPNATDWDLVYQFVKENDAFHLLYKQIGSVAYREYQKLGIQIPGTEHYDKESISILKV